MKKEISIIIALLAVGITFFIGNVVPEADKPAASSDSVLPLPSLPSFSGPLEIPSLDKTIVAAEAWTTLQNYLEFARTHNLAGVRSLSHQISPTCSHPSKEKECFALMDGVYSIASPLKLSEFKHTQADKRQIIMYTDAPTVTMLYFTKDDTGAVKMLGIRFCFEDETSLGTCVKIDSIKDDEDGDGWWDSVESLFY